MNRFEKLYDDWTKLKPVKFVIITTTLAILLTVPIGIVFQIMGLQDSEIGRPDFDKYGMTASLILVIAIGPIIETFLGQALPIYLTQKFIEWKTFGLSVLISTILFSLSHIGYSIWYSILILPTGLLLALTYITFQNRQESSFWMTFSVHSLKNLIAIIFTFKEIFK
jgi:uncharacterized protein